MNISVLYTERDSKRKKERERERFNFAKYFHEEMPEAYSLVAGPIPQASKKPRPSQLNQISLEQGQL